MGRLGLKRFMLRVVGGPQVLLLLLRRIRFGRVFKGWGPGKLYHALMAGIELLLGRKSRDVRARRTVFHDVLKVVILPLEDNSVLETERLERCPTVHAYLDPKTDELKYIPVCAWRMHNVQILRELAEKYPVAAAEAAALSSPSV
jgi:hypothetical protein